MLLRKLKLLKTREEAANEMLEAGWTESDLEFKELIDKIESELPLYVLTDLLISIDLEYTSPPCGAEKIAYIVHGRLFIESNRVYKKGLELWVNDKEVS